MMMRDGGCAYSVYEGEACVHGGVVPLFTRHPPCTASGLSLPHVWQVREEERESKENSEGDQAMTEVPSACEINQIIFHEIEHEIGSGHMYQ